MRPIVTLAVKDLRLLVRDRMALFWSLAFPLVFALFFGSIFGGREDGRGAMPIVVVDESQGEAAAAFIGRLEGSAALQVDRASDLARASDLVRRGERVAFVRIPAGFSDGAFALFGRDPATDGAAIEIGVDPARAAEQGYLVGLVNQSLFEGLSTQFADPSAMRRQVADAKAMLGQATDLDPDKKRVLADFMAALDDFSTASSATGLTRGGSGFGEGLVAVHEIARDRSGRPRSPFEVTFPAAIVWGLVGCATTFATAMVRERTAGTLLRLRVAPIGRAQILAGKGLACFVAGIAICIVLLTIAIVALGVRIVAPLSLLVAVPCAAACFTGIMMLLSVLGRTEAAVAGGSWVIMMPLAMLGGGMVPLIAMPKWMLVASNASPFKWAILAIEAGVWRDLSLPELVLPVAILLGLATALFAAGVAIFTRTITA